jgi:arabinogalactan endo-1,4-beta-galactosidase
MIRFLCLAILLVFSVNTLLLAQADKGNKQKPAVPPDASQEFSLGGDVSWLPQMEATGFKFYDKDGTEKDC